MRPNLYSARDTLYGLRYRSSRYTPYSFLPLALPKKVSLVLSEKGSIATLKEDTCDGKPAYHLHLEHKDPENPLTTEDIWFDKKTLFILKNLKYEGETKVTDTAWQDIEVNIPLSDSLFDL